MTLSASLNNCLFLFFVYAENLLFDPVHWAMPETKIIFTHYNEDHCITYFNWFLLHADKNKHDVKSKY